MTRSRFFLLVLAFMDFYVATMRLVRALSTRLLIPVMHLVKPPAGVVPHQPQMARVVARAFLARRLQRDVPRVEAQWRMCPSV